MSSFLITERPFPCKITIWHGEDWYDAIPQLTLEDGTTPCDVTNVTFELFIRPTLKHTTRFVKLTSAGSAGILKEDPEIGFVSIFYPQASVEANLPLSNAHGWRQWMRMNFTDPDLGPIKKILWTGPMIVKPAREAPTS